MELNQLVNSKATIFEDRLIILPSYPLAVEVTSLYIEIGEQVKLWKVFLGKQDGHTVRISTSLG